MQDKNEARFAEIDIVRGLVVIAMIIYHALFDLNIMGLMDLRINQGPLKLLARATAGTFFTIVGLSLYISFSRKKRRVSEGFTHSRKYLIRGGKLVAWGAVITGVTYFIYPEFVVLFGALQFIGVSIVLGYFLLELTHGLRTGFRLFYLSITLIALFFLTDPVRGSQLDHYYLLWLGVVPSAFKSLDYFPLIPWFGFVVGGLILGELLYPGGNRRYDIPEVKNRPMEFMGQHSLVIYFLHQPLLYLGIFLFTALS
ncbi:DUF1624 domain-containing protein [Candidatus Bipolaricaulota bacterium]|nr:DUF1624 domain-containing protein [Candidatus Bipolaricaulota bacterium]